MIKLTPEEVVEFLNWASDSAPQAIGNIYPLNDQEYQCDLTIAQDNIVLSNSKIDWLNRKILNEYGIVY